MKQSEPPPRWVSGALLTVVSLEALFTTAAAAILLGGSSSVAGLGALFAAPAVAGVGGIAYTMRRAKFGPVPLRLAAVATTTGLATMALASSWQLLVVGRLIVSVGGATIVSGTYASLAVDGDDRRRGLLVGLVGAAISFPAVLVPVLSAVAERFHPSFVFGGLATAVLAIVPFVPRVPRLPLGGPGFDVLRVWSGAAIVICSLWVAPNVGGWPGFMCLVGGAVAGVWIMQQGTRVSPWQNDRQHVVVGLRAVAMALFFGADILLPLYMIESLSLSAPIAAGTVVTSALGWALASAAFPAVQRSNRLETAMRFGGAALLVGVVGSAGVLRTGFSASAVAMILGGLWFAAGVGAGLVTSASTELVIVGQRTPSGATGASLQMLDAVSIAVGTGLSGFGVTQSSVFACLLALVLLAIVATAIVSFRRPHLQAGRVTIRMRAEEGVSR